MSLETPKQPDITPVQIVATLTSVVGLLVSQGIIDNNTEKLIVGLASILLPTIWVLADSIIRHGRAKMHGQIQAAKVVATGNPDVVTPPE